MTTDKHLTSGHRGAVATAELIEVPTDVGVPYDGVLRHAEQRGLRRIRKQAKQETYGDGNAYASMSKINGVT